MNSAKKSYLALVAEMEALEVQISVARQAERKAAIPKIRELMIELGITVQDLQEKAVTRQSTRLPKMPKYRDPVSGRTWSGAGRQPAWLGDDPTRFLIQPDLLNNHSDEM
ncbi:H-NS histone family protein [Burkholderia gladioli]|uniref:H-NS histone family protein n=1 Tax=Burkholderia gladioli TaxID=28095 RepID=UPI0006270889|nr:H-NS histone family protein [Burkholderia gladioli]KKJ06053.1 histone [Burkholderia gladioli]